MAMVVGNSNYNWEEMEKVGHRAVLQIFKTLTQHSYWCLVFFHDFVSLLFPPRMPPTRASSLHPTQQLRCFGRCFMSFPWRRKSSSYVSERQLHNGLCYWMYNIKPSECKASVDLFKPKVKITNQFIYCAEWNWNVHQNYILCTFDLPSSINCRGVDISRKGETFFALASSFVECYLVWK